MKKLMMLAALAAFACTAQAAKVKWGAGASTDIDATKIATGTFYLMTASDTSKIDLSKLENQTAFSAATLAAAGFDVTMATFEYSSSKFNQTDTGITPTSTGLPSNNNQPMYAFLIEDGEGADYLAYYSSTFKLVAADSLNQAKTSSTFTYVQTSSPTPEPTSGLLLLLGVAGLALRRRRA